MIEVKLVSVGLAEEVIHAAERLDIKELILHDTVKGLDIPLKPRTPGRDTAVIDAVPKKDFLKNALAVCFLIH